jgi:hypothetical protein
MTWVSNPGKEEKIIYSPKNLDLLWGPASLIFNLYEDSIPG